MFSAFCISVAVVHTLMQISTVFFANNIVQQAHLSPARVNWNRVRSGQHRGRLKDI